jgi:hypothetical protein
VHLVWDKDTDTVYVTKAWREKHTTPILHAAALKSWSADLEWAGPETASGRRWRARGSPL